MSATRLLPLADTDAATPASVARARPDGGDFVVFRDGVRLEITPESVQVISPWGGFQVGSRDPAIEAMLRALNGSPTSRADLLDGYDQASQRRLGRMMDRMQLLLCRCVMDDNREWARIVVSARGAQPYQFTTVPSTAPVRLSKFAFCRSHDGRFVVESPLAGHRVVLVDPRAQAVIGRLGEPVCSSELPDDGTSDAVAALLGHLMGLGMVDAGRWEGDQATFEVDEDPVQRQWEFHDLLFHSRSRVGRYDEAFGGVFPYVGEIDPQPPTREVHDGPATDLYRPTLDEVLATDPSLTATLEGRRSIRSYGEEPLTAQQLGEFLYRVARVRSLYGPAEGMPYEASSRPYPCGGAAYELEIYVAVRRCQGLPTGVYHYDPVGHRLVLITDSVEDRESLLHWAFVSTAGAAVPDVLFTMTSRFQRLSWKYRALAYAVTLKHVGVLYQTMYLVATAMGLAPCGLGSGHADQASDILGLDYLRESAVGEFILGSAPAPVSNDPSSRPPNWRGVNDPGWGATANERLGHSGS